MYGPGYILSWDLVAWIADNRDAFQPFIYDAPEDYAVSEMLKAGGMADESWVRVNDAEFVWASADPPHFPRPLGPDVILIHPLKSFQLLGDVLAYFLGNQTI